MHEDNGQPEAGNIDQKTEDLVEEALDKQDEEAQVKRLLTNFRIGIGETIPVKGLPFKVSNVGRKMIIIEAPPGLVMENMKRARKKAKKKKRRRG